MLNNKMTEKYIKKHYFPLRLWLVLLWYLFFFDSSIHYYVYNI